MSECAARLDLVDPCAGDAWDREALAHERSTVFHSAAWARVLARTYGHIPLYTRFSAGGKLAALLPIMEARSSVRGRRGVSLPVTDFCEPLMFQDCGAGALAGPLLELCRARRWRYFELRGPGAAPPEAAESVAFHGHCVALQPAGLVQPAEPSVRRAIRKAERSGLEAFTASDARAMEEFYRLHTLTRRRHGLQPQPVAFFQNIQRQILEAGMGFIALVRAASRVVAGSVFFRAGDRAVYKFGASDMEFQSLRPSNLAMWHGIRELAAAGVTALHLGRTSLDNEGLRRFKLGWGAREERLSYFRYDASKQAWTPGRDRAGGMHNAIFSKLPLPVNRLMGKLIYPHLD